MGKRQRGSKKGTPFERSVAKQLSLWWSGGTDDNLLWRTSQSGGRATTRAKAGKDGGLHCSDLCAINPIIDPLLKLTILELKKGYHKHTIHDLLDAPDKSVKKEYEEWIGKAERDRERAGSYFWTIIHMRDRREPMVWMPLTLADLLMVEGAMEGGTSNSACIYLRYGIDICGMLLKDFLSGTTKEHIISVLGKLNAAHQ